jgi:putative long chain acyl-CoA synthase
VRVAAFGLTDRKLKLTSDGLARECLTDEIGLLLTRVHPGDAASGTVMRDVFAAGDTWRSTNDLFLRDEQGDLWLVGSVAEIVETENGPVLPSGTRFCLGTISAVDLIVAYSVPDGDAQALVGAVTLHGDSELTATDLDAAMDRLPRRQRPRYVQAVGSIPLTTWHRPVWRELQKRGVPKPTRTRKVWRLDDSTGHYAEL